MTHITIPDVVPIVRYTANGTDTAFAYSFPIFSDTDLRVSLNGAEQQSGYTVYGAGDSNGGSVIFNIAPTIGTTVTIKRDLPIERVSDFLQGGTFTAKAINDELDYLTATLQQVQDNQAGILRYADDETPVQTILPAKAFRRNRALGFDRDGNPIAVSLEGSMAAPDFTPTGTGATTRTSHDKFSDLVSIKDFGAVGDGLSDDTIAIQNALTAHDHVLVPKGTFMVSSTIALGSYQSLIGLGQKSVIRANDDTFACIEITGEYNLIQNLRVEYGQDGILLNGKTAPCVQNAITDVTVYQAQTGVKLDGAVDTNLPCYWNNFDRVLCLQPFVHGIHLTKTGAGDTPNANKFHACRVYSLGAATTGHGIYVEDGSFNNSFVDCETNVNGATAQGCMTVGAGSNKTLFINPYCESTNQVPNIKLEAGSRDTAIYNLLSASDGASIFDLSGGDFTAYNAGFPYKNTLSTTVCSDLKATLMRYDTEFIDTAGTHTLDLSHSMHIVNATNGAITLNLPNAGDAVAAEITIKKADLTNNLITISELNGDGPDRKPLVLGGPNDYATLISNGAEWFIKSSNRMSRNTRFYDGTGTYDIDMAVDVYLVSSFGGALTTRLPPANAAEAIGRIVSIKKTDTSANVVTVSEQGGSGPDGFAQPLNSQYSAITVVSNGAQWYIVSRF